MKKTNLTLGMATLMAGLIAGSSAFAADAQNAAATTDTTTTTTTTKKEVHGKGQKGAEEVGKKSKDDACGGKDGCGGKSMKAKKKSADGATE